MVIVPSGYYSTQASKIVASMTLPSETSSTNIGVIQASIIPSTSPRYINIPTGYNSVAKYYYLSCPPDGFSEGHPSKRLLNKIHEIYPDAKIYPTQGSWLSNYRNLKIDCNPANYYGIFDEIDE